MFDSISNAMLQLAQNRYLRAIRDGIVATLPLIMVGSLFLIIATPPLPQNWAIYQWCRENAMAIVLPYRMTMGIMTVYAVMGIGHSLSKHYEIDTTTGSVAAMTAYFCTLMPKAVGAITVVEKTIDGEVFQVVTTDGTGEVLQAGLGQTLPLTNLGSQGLFVGMIVAILAVEVLRFTIKHNMTIKMPESVPSAVSNSFTALVPTTIIVLVLSTITYWIGFDMHAFIGSVMAPLVSATDSIWSVLLLVSLITLFWSVGIHGVSIIGAIVRPIWITLFDANAEAFANGTEVMNIAPEGFYQWFIWIGGSGATIGLAILLLVKSKSTFGKSLGKTVFGPAIFNINEPIIFGAPIVLNPILIPPFILAPIANAIIAYAAISTGLVHPIVAMPTWTLPGPVGAFIATGGDVNAIFLSFALIALSFLIYLPFFNKYDAQLLKEELEYTANK